MTKNVHSFIITAMPTFWQIYAVYPKHSLIEVKLHMADIPILNEQYQILCHNL